MLVQIISKANKVTLKQIEVVQKKKIKELLVEYKKFVDKKRKIKVSVDKFKARIQINKVKQL